MKNSSIEHEKSIYHTIEYIYRRIGADTNEFIMINDLIKSDVSLNVVFQRVYETIMDLTNIIRADVKDIGPLIDKAKANKVVDEVMLDFLITLASGEVNEQNAYKDACDTWIQKK